MLALNLDGAGIDVPEPVLLTAADVASLLKVSKRTLWRMQSAGRLPSPIRIGGIVRWRLVEVEEWIAAGCPAQG